MEQSLDQLAQIAERAWLRKPVDEFDVGQIRHVITGDFQFDTIPERRGIDHKILPGGAAWGYDPSSSSFDVSWFGSTDISYGLTFHGHRVFPDDVCNPRLNPWLIFFGLGRLTVSPDVCFGIGFLSQQPDSEPRYVSQKLSPDEARSQAQSASASISGRFTNVCDSTVFAAQELVYAKATARSKRAFGTGESKNSVIFLASDVRVTF